MRILYLDIFARLFSNLEIVSILKLSKFCRLASACLSESELLYDWRFTDNLSAKPLDTDDQYLFQLNTCGYNPYVTSSLTRGLVCRLQSMLALANAVILCSEPRGIMIIFYCHRHETPPNWRARSSHLYPPGTGWPRFTPRHWVPFSSSPTTRRATVEGLESTSTRGLIFIGTTAPAPFHFGFFFSILDNR
jgi:hypothetical protein